MVNSFYARGSNYERTCARARARADFPKRIKRPDDAPNYALLLSTRIIPSNYYTNTDADNTSPEHRIDIQSASGEDEAARFIA